MDEKLQYDINRAPALSALSLGKIDKYEYPTGEEKRRIKEESKGVG